MNRLALVALALLLGSALGSPIPAVALAQDEPAPKPAVKSDDKPDDEHPAPDAEPASEDPGAEDPAAEDPVDEFVPAEPPPAIAARRVQPEDPKKSIRKKLVDAIEEYHSAPNNLAGIAQRNKAWSDLVKQYREWAGKEPDNEPLRNVAFWEELLLEGLPSANPKKRGVFKDVYDDGEGTKTHWVVSVPSKYTKKSDPHPLLLTVVPKDADHKKLLKEVYGDLLATHIVVAGYESEVLADIRHLYWGIKYAESTYKINPHRIILDGLGKGAAGIDKTAPDLAIFFSAVVLRAARTATPIVGNLQMHQLMVVTPPNPGSDTRATLEVLRAVSPDLTLHETAAGKEAEANLAVQEWIAACKPRLFHDQGFVFTWTGETVGNIQKNGYWFFVRENVAAAADLLCTVRLRRDGANNFVDIESSNVSQLTLFLNDAVLDLDHPITVHVNGVKIGDFKVARKIDNIQTGLSIHRTYFLTAMLNITVPKDAWEKRKPAPKKEEPPKDVDPGGTEKPAQPHPDKESSDDSDKPPPPVPEKDKSGGIAKASDAYDRGLAYLASRRVAHAKADAESKEKPAKDCWGPDGGQPDAGVTALALLAFLDRPGGQTAEHKTIVKDAAAVLAGLQQADGGFTSETGLPATPLAVEALYAAGGHPDVASKAKDHLLAQQFGHTKRPAKPEDKDKYGGFGPAGKDAKPDLLYTVTALSALTAATLGDDSPLKRAREFLRNAKPEGDLDSAALVRSWHHAGGADGEEGKTATKSLRDRLNAEDVAKRPDGSQAGATHWLMSLVAALRPLGANAAGTTDKGPFIRWRHQVRLAVAKLIGDDGMVKDTNDRWNEGDPIVGTSLALRAIGSHCWATDELAALKKHRTKPEPKKDPPSKPVAEE